MEKYFVKRVENPKSLLCKSTRVKSITNRALDCCACRWMQCFEGVSFTMTRDIFKSITGFGVFVEVFEKNAR